MANDLFDFHGLIARTASTEECEDATYVVCCRAGVPSPYPDNVSGTCGICAHAVYFRPYMPKTPMRICLECFRMATRPS